MRKEVLGECPVCNSNLEVTKLHCSHCNTNIEGHFEMCRFCRLSQEHKYFIEVFIKNRGNLKEIEKELNISYPTIKSRLESAIKSLGYHIKEDIPIVNDLDKKTILQKLNEGKISAEEAINLIKASSKK